MVKQFVEPDLTRAQFVDMLCEISPLVKICVGNNLLRHDLPTLMDHAVKDIFLRGENSFDHAKVGILRYYYRKLHVEDGELTFHENKND